MIKFLRDLILGEPALSLGLIAAGLGAWVAALVAGDQTVPLWLAASAPAASAVAAIYTRQTSTPIKATSPFIRSPEVVGRHEASD